MQTEICQPCRRRFSLVSVRDNDLCRECLEPCFQGCSREPTTQNNKKSLPGYALWSRPKIVLIYCSNMSKHINCRHSVNKVFFKLHSAKPNEKSITMQSSSSCRAPHVLRHIEKHDLRSIYGRSFVTRMLSGYLIL